VADAFARSCVRALASYWSEALPDPDAAAAVFAGLDRDAAATVISRAARSDRPPTAPELRRLMREVLRPVGRAGVAAARSALYEARSA